MNWRSLFLTSFGIIFLSEMGDKTQVTTMLLAGEKPAYVAYVALGSVMALITASFIEIMIGSTLVAKFLRGRKIKVASGCAFTLMGLILLARYL